MDGLQGFQTTTRRFAVFYKGCFIEFYFKQDSKFRRLSQKWAWLKLPFRYAEVFPLYLYRPPFLWVSISYLSELVFCWLPFTLEGHKATKNVSSPTQTMHPWIEGAVPCWTTEMFTSFMLCMHIWFLNTKWMMWPHKSHQENLPWWVRWVKNQPAT